jgi:hypothetical protein
MLSPAYDRVQTEPACDNVVVLTFGRKTTDGGRARIMSRRKVVYPSDLINVDDLVMLRGDDTAPCEMNPCASV